MNQLTNETSIKNNIFQFKKKKFQKQKYQTRLINFSLKGLYTRFNVDGNDSCIRKPLQNARYPLIKFIRG